MLLNTHAYNLLYKYDLCLHAWTCGLVKTILNTHVYNLLYIYDRCLHEV